MTYQILGGLIAALIMASPATAQQSPDAGAWSVKRDLATVTVSGIGIPTQPGSLSLTKTAEASQKGKGIDDYAQYESADGAVFGTVYIFYTSYADTALAAWATDRAVHQRFGAAVALASDTLAPVAGVANAAARRIYVKGEMQGHPLATAAGFVRAGSWLVGIRTTGPADRQQETEAAFDAIVTGMRFDGKSKPMVASLLKMTAPCPIGVEQPAEPLADKNAAGTAFFASLFGGSITLSDDSKGTTTKVELPVSFPANGASPMCVRSTIVNGENRNDVLQPADAADGLRLLIPIDDAGGVLAVEPTLIGEGFIVKHYGIGFTDVLGGYKTMPSIDQLRAIMTGEDKKGSAVRSSTTFTPDGNSSININADMLK